MTKYLYPVFSIFILFSCTEKASTEWAQEDSVIEVVPGVDTAPVFAPMQTEEIKGSEFPPPTDSLPKTSFIPAGYEVADEVFGHLNEDTLQDCVLRIRTEDGDYHFLLILLKNPNNTYSLSLHTSSFISMRYGTEVEIKDSSLYIRTDHPWHGINMAQYVLVLKGSDWYCLRASSTHDDGAGNYWGNSINYETGAFSISHSYTTLEGKTFDRKEEGVIKAVLFPVSKNNETSLLTIEWKGKEYYIWDRNNLWSAEEIVNLLPPEYRSLVGNWHTEKDQKIYIRFQPEGVFYFNDFNGIKNKYEYLSGNYTLKNNILTLQYSDRSQQRFTITTINGKTHITKTGGYDFVKEK